MSATTSQPSHDLITPAQLAEMLGLHRTTIYGWIRRGEITPIRLRSTGRMALHASVIDEVRRPA